MKNLFKYLLSGSITAMLVLVSFALPTVADEGSIARGGQLYDKWYSVIKEKGPKETHPAWPTTNTAKSGATTWRCKSCHGWDYKGVNGAYGYSKSYLTGIKGIDGMAGADIDAIIAVLKDDTHQLADRMDDADFKDLAMFVSKGQIDMSQYIDTKTKAFSGGNAEVGANYYNTLCSQCHGKDGNKPKDMPESLGSLMSGNPWEAMHKILNGQPNENMPALRALDRQITLDIMAYLATLPTEM